MPTSLTINYTYNNTCYVIIGSARKVNNQMNRIRAGCSRRHVNQSVVHHTVTILVKHHLARLPYCKQ